MKLMPTARSLKSHAGDPRAASSSIFLMVLKHFCETAYGEAAHKARRILRAHPRATWPRPFSRRLLRRRGSAAFTT